ncbi:MAG: hypothetical protein ACRCU5_16670 [Rhizobiaceae bacterium]
MIALEEFADRRLYGRCFLCGSNLKQGKTTRDHAPPKCWLGEPIPENEPTIFACRKCNNDLSDDEQYTAAFMSAVLSGSHKKEDQILDVGARILSSNGRIRRKIKKSQSWENDNQNWRPDGLIFDRVIVKNARGHVFYELAEIRDEEPALTNHLPLLKMTQEDVLSFFEPFLDGPWPEIGTRAFIRASNGSDLTEGWVIVKPGVYRYRVTVDGLYVQAIWHEYLAIETLWEH